MNTEGRRRSVRRGVFAVLAAAIGATALLAAAPAGAQEALVCGEPRRGMLAGGGTQAWVVATAPGASVLIQTASLTASMGPVRMRVSGAQGVIADTCSGVVQFTSGPQSVLVEVSQCFGGAGGAYAISANVVTDGAGNCGRPLTCGATPDGIGFDMPGEVDSFLLSAGSAEPVTLRLNYTTGSGAPSVRLFDPDGVELPVENRCGGQITFTPAKVGLYTALVSACGPPVSRPYRVELSEPGCPAGPVITAMGIANASNAVQRPIGYDEAGRPVFHQQFGHSLTLVIEGRAGANRQNPGPYPAPYFVNAELHDPDLQVIVSRPLGNGDPTICDTFLPELGGVPATEPFAFQDTAPALDIIHDLGCRFFDGAGQLVARQSSLEACTTSDEGFGFGYIDRNSRLQFCGMINPAWAFPTGDTLVAARLKDARTEEFGTPREIVVRVGPATPVTPTPTATAFANATRTAPRTPTPTATRTRTATSRPSATATRTRTATRTPTPTATGPTPTEHPFCAGDCSTDNIVTIEDLIRTLAVVLGTVSLVDCPAADGDHNGRLDIGDLVLAVTRALDGCP